jgi:CBS domain containing-hemolysin-like protein
VSDSKTITITYSQGWSIISGIAIAVFVLTMIYFRFSAMETSLETLEEREIKKHDRQEQKIEAILKKKLKL